MPECAVCGHNRKKVHRTVMIDNRGKEPKRIGMPICVPCLDYLGARAEHLG